MRKKSVPTRFLVGAGFWRLALVLACTLGFIVPAEAGHYKLVRYSGSGGVTRTFSDGTTHTDPISSSWDESYPGGADALPLPLTELYPDEKVDCNFTETYELQWVEDYPGEPPQDDIWEVDWDSTINWSGTSGMAWDAASMSGYTKATGGTSAGASYQLSGSMNSTPDGMGGATISESGDIGDLIGWLEFPVSGSNPSITVTYEASMTITGPALGYLLLQRTPAKPAKSTVTITSPTDGQEFNVGSSIDVDVTYSTTKRGKAGAPVPPGATPTPYHLLITIQPPSGSAQTLHFYLTTASGSVTAGFVPNQTGKWKIYAALEVSDGKKWNRVASTGPVTLTIK